MRLKLKGKLKMGPKTSVGGGGGGGYFLSIACPLARTNVKMGKLMDKLQK